jgi:DNA polymerase-3 subunit delta'
MIIWLPEAMNQEAANKILKILEEPWDKTLFILVSEHPELLLQTITSRTQEVSVGRIDVATLQSVAEREGKSREEAHNIARLAGGSILELRELLRGETDESRAQSFELFTRLMRLSYNDKHLELFEWADDIAALTREGQRQFFLHAVRLLRESYMLHAGLGSISYLWGEEQAFCKKFAPFIGNQNIEILVEEIERAMLQISQNGSPRIVFTHFALAVSKQINRLQ